MMRGGAVSLMIWLMTTTMVTGQDLVFEETFSTDPIAEGRLVVHDGDAGRFVYDETNDLMTASYDTDLATARLIHDLGESFTHEDNFTITFDFEILSVGFFADPCASAQIAMGAMNSATTGTDRAGGTGGDAFDIVTFDYFPNVTAFGGPSLGPASINTDTGAAYFDHLDFEFGPETNMSVEGSLPMDTTLTAEIVYDSCTRIMTLTVADSVGPMAINTDGAGNVFGGLDGDETTIQTINTMPFVIDSVGILLWEDTYGGAACTGPTVHADVEVTHIRFEGTHFNQAARSDRDSDGDVDGVDFSIFASCFNKAGNPPRMLGCNTDAAQAFDYDCDGDVDGVDFSIFASCFNKAGNPPRTIGCSSGV